jgi:Uma2 family endonuclease
MYNRSVQLAVYLEAPYVLPRERGPYRLADYMAMPDEPRCEIWRGHCVLTAAPRVKHQRIVGTLYELLARHMRAHGGLALLSPTDVALSDDTILQPDVLYLAPESLDKADQWVTGPPDLVVEVVSPSEARRDRLFKLNFYLEAGVREYWIVDGAERTIELLVNREGRFVVERPDDAELYRSPILANLELDVARLWRAVDDPRAEP